MSSHNPALRAPSSGVRRLRLAQHAVFLIAAITFIGCADSNEGTGPGSADAVDGDGGVVDVCSGSDCDPEETDIEPDIAPDVAPADTDVGGTEDTDAGFDADTSADVDADTDAGPTCDPAACAATADACSDASCVGGACRVTPKRNGAACDGADGVCFDGTCGVCADTESSGVDAGCSFAAPSCVEGACIVCETEGPGCVVDCAGVLGGLAREDACGTCDANPANDCIPPCEGEECAVVCVADSDCDDLNPCTVDACSAGVCANDGAPRDGDTCDDYDACTETSTCSSGACVGSDPITCDGPCLTGGCDPSRGCEVEEAATLCHACPDDDPGCDDIAYAGACDDGGVCVQHCAPGFGDAPVSPCVTSTLDLAELALTGEVRCNTTYNAGALCASDGDHCTDDVCNDSGVCEHTPNDSCNTCTGDDCDPTSCDGVVCEGPCLTGACVDGACVREPAGLACDDGSANTTNDVCTPEATCRGECAELECGSYFSFLGSPCGGIVTGSGANAECDDGNPCTANYCASDGTCGTTALPAGAACSTGCGSGSCSLDGVCELTTTSCLSNSCYRSACNTETGSCEISEYVHEACAEPTNTCDPALGACVPRWGGWCGDGICSPDEGCTRDCGSSCLGTSWLCDNRYNEVQWGGVWRAHQSVPYGFVGTDAHQSQTFTRMLDDGFRWLHLLIDYCTPGETDGPLCLCAGNDACLTNTFYLEDGLDEIGTWMDANPREVVTLYTTSYATGPALRAEVEGAGLGDRVYTSTAAGASYESWPLTLGEMANLGRTLVIFGNGYLRTSNVFRATEAPAGGPPSPAGLFAAGGPEEFACLGDGGALPPEAALYAFSHTIGGASSFNSAACYNEYIFEHEEYCEAYREEANVIFAEYYNASSELGDWADGHQHAYVDRCFEAVEGCLTDDDCEDGNVCGGLFICLNCINHDDCDENEHCDSSIGSCVADLPDGSVCLDDAVCQSGTCELLCQSCSSDADCDGDEWCDAFGGCQQPQPIGAGCVNPHECRSGECFLGYCVACDEQSDCTDDGQFCSLSPLPGESACIDRKPNGELCASDFECAGDTCFLGACAGCNEQSDCSDDGQFCTLDPRPGESACIDRKPNRYACAQTLECASGNCFLGFCVACDEQDDCTEPDQFCSLDPIPGQSECVDQKEIGEPCGSPFECTSGDCFLGFCVACDEQDDCTEPDQFCSLDPAPGASRCIDRKDNGALCVQGFECQSDACTLGVCGECATNEQCDASEHCDAFNNCAPDVGNNEPCLQDGACTTGICSAGFCAECTSDDHCDASDHCDPFGDCVADVGNNAPCTRDSVCATGICSAGFCAECTSDDHCDASDHCDAGGDCIADVGNNAPCTRNAVCTTGICSAGFCAECTSDGHCAGNEHCDAGGDCIADVGNGTACTRDSVCSSGACHLGFCAACNDQGDCPAPDDFCSLDPAPGASACIAEKANGSVCANGFECSSNQCTLGFCGECVNDGQCAGNQHCDAFNNCVADVGNNAPCLRDAACTTGICSAGFCAECTNDGHCSGNEHCDAGGDCAPDVGNNDPCIKDSACSTGLCLRGFCAQCNDGADHECAPSQHCNAVNDCVADVGNNSPCLRDAVCSTGICSAGFCAECTSDGHCPSNEHCDVGGDCVADVGNNAPCLRDAVCNTGICSAGFCAQCTSDGHCASNQFCNGSGDCQNKLGNGSICVEHRVCSSGCCGVGFCGGLGC